MFDQFLMHLKLDRKSLMRSAFPDTGIPRLTRFYIARFPIAQIFEVVQENLHSTVLYLKIYSVMQMYVWIFFLDELRNFTISDFPKQTHLGYTLIIYNFKHECTRCF